MTAPSPEAQAAVLVATYQQSTQRLRDYLTAFVTSLWGSLGTYRNEQAAQFVAQVVPVVAGAQQQMASLTSAYLAAHKTSTLGISATPVPVDPKKVTGAAARGGVDPAEVYGRPFHLVWRQIGDGQRQRDAHYEALDAGKPLEEIPTLPPDDFIDRAIQSGLDRAVQSALTDLQLTKVQTSQAVLEHDGRVVGYRRVLEGEASCALCVVASTLRYHKGELLPIHPGCDCSVQPIYANADPGVTIDDSRLAAARQAIADRFGRANAGARYIANSGGKQYRDVIISHEHGELGPVLAVRGRPFKGPDGLAK